MIPGDPSSDTRVQMQGLPHRKALPVLSKASGVGSGIWKIQPAVGSKRVTASLAGGRFIPESRFSLVYSIRATLKGFWVLF